MTMTGTSDENQASFFWLEYKVLERGRYCFLDM